MLKLFLSYFMMTLSSNIDRDKLLIRVIWIKQDNNIKIFCVPGPKQIRKRWRCWRIITYLYNCTHLDFFGRLTSFSCNQNASIYAAVCITMGLICCMTKQDLVCWGFMWYGDFVIIWQYLAALSRAHAAVLSCLWWSRSYTLRAHKHHRHFWQSVQHHFLLVQTNVCRWRVDFDVDA